MPNTLRTPAEACPNSQFSIRRIAYEQNINALRLPNFAILDVRVENRFGFKHFSFAPYSDYFNITTQDSNVESNYEFYQPTPQFLRENKRLRFSVC